jgi:hypothetical protein
VSLQTHRLPPRTVNPHEIHELTGAMRKAGRSATGGTVAQIELDLGDSPSGPSGVDRHPDLHPESRGERQDVT